jgi:hypothetical protein
MCGQLGQGLCWYSQVGGEEYLGCVVSWGGGCAGILRYVARDTCYVRSAGAGAVLVFSGRWLGIPGMCGQLGQGLCWYSQVGGWRGIPRRWGQLGQGLCWYSQVGGEGYLGCVVSWDRGCAGILR